MTWLVMDITDMTAFDSNTFDLAIDKSTIDALLCGENAFEKVSFMLKETQRVLRIGGSYFAISYGRPEGRAFHFEQPFLSFENRQIMLPDPTAQTEEEKKDRAHYVYISKKLPDADEVSDFEFLKHIERMRVQEQIEIEEELERD